MIHDDISFDSPRNRPIQAYHMSGVISCFTDPASSTTVATCPSACFPSASACLFSSCCCEPGRISRSMMLFSRTFISEKGCYLSMIWVNLREECTVRVLYSTTVDCFVGEGQPFDRGSARPPCLGSDIPNIYVTMRPFISATKDWRGGRV